MYVIETCFLLDNNIITDTTLTNLQFIIFRFPEIRTFKEPVKMLMLIRLGAFMGLK